MRWLLSVLGCLFCSLVLAVPASWKIVPEKSKLTFSATQSDAPIEAGFAKFSGEILFSPDQLADSRVKITIDMTSVAAEYKDLEDSLRTSDWFDVAQFPQAVFVSNSFTKVDDQTFRCEGKLTLRDKTAPVTLKFRLKKFDDANAEVVGTANLQRLDFGVGQGEWSKTDEVENAVEVQFVISARRG